MMKKLSYKKSYNKKSIRNLVIEKGTNVIGLGGPDLADYVKFFRSKGYTSITVYENDAEMLLKQMPQINNIRGISYHFADIIEAPILPNTLYDIDFCVTITSVKDHVRKFQKNFVLTVSEFRKPRFWTVNQFLKIRGEHKISLTENVKDTIKTLVTDKGVYTFFYYFDKSPMIVIKSVNK